MPTVYCVTSPVACYCENCGSIWMEIQQVCAEFWNLMVSLHEGSCVRRKKLYCMRLADIWRKQGKTSLTLQLALHCLLLPEHLVLACGNYLLGNYGIQVLPVCPDSISTLSFWCSRLLRAGPQEKLECPLPGSGCLIAMSPLGPWFFPLFLKRTCSHS